jgi:hypothetical protein
MRILIGFAPNPANPRKIRWWLYCYAWWLDDFLGNFSISIDDIKNARNEFDSSIPFDVKGDNLSTQQLDDFFWNY